jgi:hypothetical protein
MALLPSKEPARPMKYQRAFAIATAAASPRAVAEASSWNSLGCTFVPYRECAADQQKI